MIAITHGYYSLLTGRAHYRWQTIVNEDYRAKNTTSRELHNKADLLLRAIVAVNLLLVALSWSTWFEGSEHQIGAADRLFGWFRFGGFRGDLVWLFFSTSVLSFLFVHFLIKAKETPHARASAIFLAGIIAFCLFMYRTLTGGLLYFG